MNIDLSKKWTPYLTRPFNLFTTSLWQAWYESEHMQEALGFKMDEVLCIEVEKNIVRQYRTKDQLKRLSEGFRHLLYNDIKKLENLLQHGINLSTKVDAIVKKPCGGFTEIKQAISFFNELIFFTTVFPNFPSIVLNPSETLPPSVEKLFMKLRKTSYYPRFMKQIIIPLALHHCTTKDLELLTANELLSPEKSFIIKQRQINRGKLFIYQKLSGKETINLVSSPKSILEKIGSTNVTQSVVTGVCAFPGIVRGKVHMVKDFMNPGIMKKGQVLVSISSNPILLPLMKKSCAIVTDEGGTTSHAAIISRECGIPCIVGTKIATQVFKDGDVVEVDATKGIIKRLK